MEELKQGLEEYKSSTADDTESVAQMTASVMKDAASSSMMSSDSRGSAQKLAKYKVAKPLAAGASKKSSGLRR